MSRPTTLTVRVEGALSDFVATKVGEDGTYENAGERLKAELQHAFAAPDSSYRPLTAAEVIARNSR